MRLKLVALCALLLSAAAAAAAPVDRPALTIPPHGTAIVLDRASETVTKETANQGIVARGVNGTPERVTLIYVAPQAKDTLEDVVRFTQGSDDVTIPIHVQNPAPTLTDPAFYTASFKALVALFVLAILMENALALLFRWRPYLKIFDSHGLNPVVAFAFSYIVVAIFDLDIASSLVNTYSGTHYPSAVPGMLITAMIIAGGSAGVTRIFRAMGFRPPAGSEEPAPEKPDQTKAWLSIALLGRLNGPVDVLIDDGDKVRGAAGTITRSEGRWFFIRPFVRNRGRFPASGGYEVEAGKDVTVQLVEQKNPATIIFTWGPKKLAPRAIVDLEAAIKSKRSDAA